MTKPSGFHGILVATDFSPPADTALQQAVWLTQTTGASLSLVHVLPLRMASSADPKLDLYLELLKDEVDAEELQSEAIEEAQAKLRKIVERTGVSTDVQTNVYIGESYVEITRAVQQGGCDLVLAGTRGLARWEEFFVGSTAKRLIRNCPSSVWIVKPEHVGRPKVVLAATDFSPVSSKAVQQGHWIAQQAQAAFHLLHVVDSKDVPEDAISHVTEGSSLQQEIVEEATKRMERFVDSLGVDRASIQVHQSWGTPWQEIRRAAKYQAADLVVIGTVGRSGVKGLLLGNTAEKVLDACDCSILAVKPDEFQSPLDL
jgi:nucleotide-binding universal stress UspA family protein